MKLETAVAEVNKSVAHLLNSLDDFVQRQQADQGLDNSELESITITMTVTSAGPSTNFSCIYAPINLGGEYNI